MHRTHSAHMRACRLMLCVVLIVAMQSHIGAALPTDDDAAVESKKVALEMEMILSTAASRILEMQEGETNAEWPYEGVYRVRDGGRSVIPIGYRVGGTAICAMALLSLAEFEADDDRLAAIDRAALFIIESIHHPLMAFDHIPGTYDVRGWGYTYGLLFLLEYRDRTEGDDERHAQIDEAVRFFIAGINATEIPRSGGWNYARRGGFDQPGGTSPFMTAPTLQALFKARYAGYEVDAEVVERGLDALERARLESGAFVYSGAAGGGRSAREQVPGAAARMAAAEATLYLGGRGDLSRVRSAIDAFIVHWEWLDQRRAQQGTHIPPYGIAPYYFYFAHYYAAQAIELLPRQDREEYRRRINQLLMRNHLDDGTWNDRVFPRSANYGTAMSIMALRMAEIPAPPPWDADPAQAADGE